VQAAISAGGGRDKKLLKSVGGSAALRVPDNGLKRSVDRSTAKELGALGAALGTPALSRGTIALFVILIGGTLFTAAAARRERR
jgi:4-amino-4-deoxy-L-arabinose transferase-like glycosyltransferase